MTNRKTLQAAVAEGESQLVEARGRYEELCIVLCVILATISNNVPGTDFSFFSYPTTQLISPFVAALLGLTLNQAAFSSEIIRGGILSVDQGQLEAAAALGLSRRRQISRIVLPQAMRIIIPPTGNEFINMLKTSSLVYAVQFPELLLSAVNIYSSNLMVIELLFTVSLWYLVLTSVFSIGQHFLEKRFARGASGQPAGGGVFGTVMANLRPGRTR